MAQVVVFLAIGYTIGEFLVYPMAIGYIIGEFPLIFVIYTNITVIVTTFHHYQRRLLESKVISLQQSKLLHPYLNPFNLKRALVLC